MTIVDMPIPFNGQVTTRMIPHGNVFQSMQTNPREIDMSQLFCVAKENRVVLIKLYLIHNIYEDYHGPKSECNL